MFNVKKLAFGAAMLAASAVCFAAPKVEIVTSEGNIVVNHNEKAAPTTVANFVKYAKEGFYNGTIFHRVINNFMIQGGGFDRNLHQKSTHAPIKLEDKNGLKNTVGTIAMARTNNPDSATSQFFIIHETLGSCRSTADLANDIHTGDDFTENSVTVLRGCAVKEVVSFRLMKNWLVAESGLFVRAIAMVPTVFSDRSYLRV